MLANAQPHFEGLLGAISVAISGLGAAGAISGVVSGLGAVGASSGTRLPG